MSAPFPPRRRQGRPRARFYLHLEPGTCFAGCGIWRPGADALVRIRDAIVERPDEWTRITRTGAFRDGFELMGEALKRPPRRCDPGHPLIEDLKRKDFVAVARFPEAEACRPDFPERFAGMARGGADFLRFLARAVGVPF